MKGKRLKQSGKSFHQSFPLSTPGRALPKEINETEGASDWVLGTFSLGLSNPNGNQTKTIAVN